MTHLEQLVAEWLQYKGYFVRTSVLVGPRAKGGHEGELDVVGFNTTNKHLIHVECSADGNSWAVRQRRFAAKFVRGKLYVRKQFAGMELPQTIDHVAVLQFVGGNAPDQLGGGRIISTKQLIREIFDGLKGKRPASGAVPSTFPLLRTLQLAADAQTVPSDPRHRVIPEASTRADSGNDA